MARQKKYFRLGLLLLGGAGLITLAAVVFGLGVLFKESTPAETYFTETVEGLEYGTAVKFRGVQVGSVASIGFVAEDYPQADAHQGAYVLVRMDLYKKLPSGFKLSGATAELPQLIERGLRIRKTTQGITGVTYLEIDFLDPLRNPLLPIGWQPRRDYIPSAPSTISRLEGALGNISKTLEQISEIDLGKLAESVQSIMVQLDKSLKDANVASLGQLLAQNLEETKKAVNRVNALLANPEAEKIIPDAAQGMTSFRRLAGATEKELPRMIAELNAAAKALGGTAQTLSDLVGDPAFRAGVRELPAAMANVRKASEGFVESSARLAALLRNVNELTLRQREDIGAIVDNLNTVTRNLGELSEDARQNPSRLILGQPPRPVAPR